MRSFLINKNLAVYHSLKRMIGKKWGFVVASTIEKVILIFGREEIPGVSKHKIPKNKNGD